MHIGAQPVPPSLIHHWKRLFPEPSSMIPTTVCSESIGPGCVHLGVENIHKVGAIGKPGYRLEGEDLWMKVGNEVPQGEVGRARS